MTPAVPSGTDQSTLAAPSLAVSPETPAFATVTSQPLARSAACNTAGKSVPGGRPKPAVRLSPSATTVAGASGVSGSAVVADAEKYLGVPYVWGGESNSGLDCSGLVQKTFKDLGINVPRIAADQQKPRTTATVVTVISIAVLAYMFLNGSYIQPYTTALGQVILLVLGSAYVGILLWMRSMSKPPKSMRLMVSPDGAAR